MKPEIRFLRAILRMLGVLVGTNVLFPPVVPEAPPAADSVAIQAGDTAAPTNAATTHDTGGAPVPALPGGGGAGAADTAAGGAAGVPAVPVLPGAGAGNGGRVVVVEGPLYRYEFSTVGARVGSVRLLQFEALNREGVVELVPEGLDGYFGHRLVVGADTVDLTGVPYRVEPEDGLTLSDENPTGTLAFIYEHPSGSLDVEVRYSFHATNYQVQVDGAVRGLDRAL